MPTGLVLDDRHWSALAAALERHPAWLIYDAAMERIRFDGRPRSHPAAQPGLALSSTAPSCGTSRCRLR
jgi:aspartate/methionine/tyrosine aminotransferase